MSKNPMAKAQEYTPEGLASLTRSVEWHSDKRPHTNTCARSIFAACAFFYFGMTIVLMSAGKEKYEFTDSGIPYAWSEDFEAPCQDCCEKMFPDAVYGPYAWYVTNTDTDSDFVGTFCWEVDMAASVKPYLEADDDEADLSEYRPIPTSLWAGFADHPYVPLVLVIALLVMATVWLVLLSKYAVTILFGTYGLIFLAVAWLMVSSENWIMLIPMAALVLWVHCSKQKIIDAGVLTRQACTHILELPSLMAAIYSWLAAPSAIVLLLLTQIICGGKVREVNYTNCSVVEQGWASTVIFFNSIIFYWMWSTSGMIQVYMVAGCIGTQHFHPKDKPAWMPVHFIKLACWRNLGTVSIASFFTALFDYIRSKIRCGCNCSCIWNLLNWPIYLFCLIVYCCLKNLIEMLSHFTTIFHVMTAKPFWEAAKDTQSLMEKNGFGGIVLTSSTKLTFGIVKYCVSVVFGLASWAWMQDAYGAGIDDLDGGFRMFLIVVMMLCMQNCWGTVFFVVFLAMIDVMSIIALFGTDIVEGVTAYLLGLFTGAVCGLFFKEVCAAILAACETMFVIVAIEQATPHLNDESSTERGVFAKIITAKVVQVPMASVHVIDAANVHVELPQAQTHAGVPFMSNPMNGGAEAIPEGWEKHSTVGDDGAEVVYYSDAKGDTHWDLP